MDKESARSTHIWPQTFAISNPVGDSLGASATKTQCHVRSISDRWLIALQAAQFSQMSFQSRNILMTGAKLLPRFREGVANGTFGLGMLTYAHPDLDQIVEYAE